MNRHSVTGKNDRTEPHREVPFRAGQRDDPRIEEETTMLHETKISRMIPRLVGVLLFTVFIALAASDAEARTLVFIHGKNEGRLPVSTIQNTYWTQEMIRAS